MAYVLDLAAHSGLPVETVLRVLLRKPTNEGARERVADAVAALGLPSYPLPDDHLEILPPENGTAPFGRERMDDLELSRCGPGRPGGERARPHEVAGRARRVLRAVGRPRGDRRASRPGPRLRTLRRGRGLRS